MVCLSNPTYTSVPYTHPSYSEQVDGKCYLRGFSGFLFLLERDGLDWHIVAVNGTSCVGNIYLEYESVKQSISGAVLHEPDLYK